MSSQVITITSTTTLNFYFIFHVALWWDLRGCTRHADWQMGPRIEGLEIDLSVSKARD